MLLRRVTRTSGGTLLSTLTAFIEPGSIGTSTDRHGGLWPRTYITRTASCPLALHGGRGSIAAAPVLIPLSRCVSLAATDGPPGSWRCFAAWESRVYDYRFNSNCGGSRRDWSSSSRDRDQGARSPGNSSPQDPYSIQAMYDMPSLAGLVNQSVSTWSQKQDIGVLRAAFHRLAKVGTQPGANRALVRTTFRTLQTAYLRLVPILEDPYSCVGPLWVCAKLRIWDADSLPEAVLRRLGEPGADAAAAPGVDKGASERRMAGATGQMHANLWWSISQAPRWVAAAAAVPLRDSAACLLLLPPGQLNAELNAQDCANILLAFSQLHWYAKPTLVHRLTACLAAKPDANCQDLAGALAALGSLSNECGHKPRHKDLDRLCGAVLERLALQSADQLAPPPPPAQPVWTQSGTVRRPGDAREGGHGGGFTPRQLSSMLLGCAKLRSPPPRLLQTLIPAVGAAAGSTSAQALALALHALALLGSSRCEHDQVVERLCTELHQRLLAKVYGFTAQELSYMAWSLERLRRRAVAGSDGLLSALAAECSSRRFAGFHPQALSETVLALARLGLRDQGCYAAAAAAAMQPGARLQDWSDLLCGLALVRWRPPEGLLQQMRDDTGLTQLGAGAGRPEPQRGAPGVLPGAASARHCAVLLWALAELGLSERWLVDGLAGRLGQELCKDPARVHSRALASALWALAVMGPEALRRHGGVVEGLLREAARRWEWEQRGGREGGGAGTAVDGGAADSSLALGPLELRQLWQVQLELSAAEGVGALGRVLGRPGPGSLLAAAREAAVRHAAPRPQPSELLRRVLRSLTQLQRRLTDPQARSAAGRSHPSAGDGSAPSSSLQAGGGGDGGGVLIKDIRPLHPVKGLLSRVDVEVELSGFRRVAVAVEGPACFLTNEPYTRTKSGPMELRDRQLQRVYGIGNVVHVPYWEWNELETEGQQIKYLCRLLVLPVPKL